MPIRPSRWRSRVRRSFILLIVLVVAGGAAFAPFAGRFLVVDEAVQPSDAMFVLAGARVERWLESVDLYRAGDAPIVVLSPGIVEPAEANLRARGIRFPADADLARDAMIQMHVPPSAVMVLAATVDNTAQEAAALHALARSRAWHRIIVITSKYHSRRAAFAFRREFAGSGITILPHTSRYDTTDPAHWWRHRSDIRYVTSEYQKLLAYHLGLGE
jgi:uncharacterized SAM-binding protein YcdF (DUF218 family)